jgi:hypothetical protein
MIRKEFLPKEWACEYLYDLETMSSKEAKKAWRKAIKESWNNQCAYCGGTPIDDRSLTLDHVRPKSKGGQDRTSNCVPACKKCNHSKGSENWLEWFERQDFYSRIAEARIKRWLNTDMNSDLIQEGQMLRLNQEAV